MCQDANCSYVRVAYDILVKSYLVAYDILPYAARFLWNPFYFNPKKKFK